METIQGTLRGSLQNLLLNRMIRAVGAEDNAWKALVIDRAALRILAAALPVNDLVNERVSIIELIDMRREPLPRTPAIYFLTPTPESVQQLCCESAKQYRSFHVFFTSRLPDYLLAEIRQHKDVLRKIRSLVELNVQLLALESRLFSLDRPAASLPQIHASSESDARDEFSTLSERLSDACMLLAPKLDWQIRTDAASQNSRTVASLVKEQISSVQMQQADKERRDGAPPDAQEDVPHEADNAPRRATLLIVDRAADLTSPLVHEYTYQAMAHDLLPLNYQKPGGAHIEIESDTPGRPPKFEQLDAEEGDPVWGSVRWAFVQEALDHAAGAFREFMATNAAYKVAAQKSDLEVRDLGAAVRAVPEAKRHADKYTMHVANLRECVAKCERLGLTDLALVEQDLAVGIAADGTKLKSEPMLDRIKAVLGTTGTPLEHRVRLLVISLIVAEGLMGLGGENSELAFSPNYRQRLLRSELPELLAGELTDELSASVRGAQHILQRTRAANDAASLQRTGRRARHGADGDPDALDGVAARLRQRYAAHQARKQQKRLRAARDARHELEKQDDKYDIARYRPPLRSVMMELVDDELDEQAFPTMGEISIASIIESAGSGSFAASGVFDDHTTGGGSHRTPGRVRTPGARRPGANARRERTPALMSVLQSFGRPGSVKSDDSSMTDRRADADHLFVVFVIGGVCYSEARAMYEVCAKREANILIGGSQVLTPGSFLDALAAVADPVLRIKITLPPLPLELAQTRAAAAAREEAEREAQERARAEAAEASGAAADDGMEGGGEEVHIVTSYKKKRGFRLFGKRR